jgi:hypothetical protein
MSEKGHSGSSNRFTNYNEIELYHPQYIKALNDLLTYEAKVEEFLMHRYGNNTVENILNTAKYHDYINDNNNDGSILSKMAKKRNLLFEVYLLHFAPLISQHGYATAVEYDTIATTHIKQTI